MHDIHLADKIIKKVLEFAKENKLSKVEKVDIKIGNILEHGELISPEGLNFNLKLLAKETILQNAEFIIERCDRKGEYEIVEIEGE